MADNPAVFSLHVHGANMAFVLGNLTEAEVRQVGPVFAAIASFDSVYMVYGPTTATESFKGTVNGHASGPRT